MADVLLIRFATEVDQNVPGEEIHEVAVCSRRSRFFGVVFGSALFDVYRYIHSAWSRVHSLYQVLVFRDLRRYDWRGFSHGHDTVVLNEHFPQAEN